MTRNHQSNGSTTTASRTAGDQFFVYLVAAQAQSLALAADLQPAHEQRPSSGKRLVEVEGGR